MLVGVPIATSSRVLWAGKHGKAAGVVEALAAVALREPMFAIVVSLNEGWVVIVGDVRNRPPETVALNLAVRVLLVELDPFVV